MYITMHVNMTVWISQTINSSNMYACGHEFISKFMKYGHQSNTFCFTFCLINIYKYSKAKYKLKIVFTGKQ